MKDCFVSFRTSIEGVEIPPQLNNPFGLEISEIAKIAAKELQGYIARNESRWAHNFGFDHSMEQGVKGKMFGVLVVRNSRNELGYLTTFSGKLVDDNEDNQFVPSVFDSAVDDCFINHGMTALTALSNQIKALKADQNPNNQPKIAELKNARKNKSYELQQQLFENYHFTNINGLTKNLIDIFSTPVYKRPAAGTGECAAPKLLEYALKNSLKPIAIAEFWWGRSPKSVQRIHKSFYPACQNKCRHLLEYMLNDLTLFDTASPDL
jgi:tRNA pseudouridine32 synthase/23S rRNA pseudouridine746 synthase